MKKFLLATAAIFCLMFGQAQAADVYATTEVTKDGKITDVYVNLDAKGKSIIFEKSYGIKVMLHSIGRNHRKNTHWGLGFKVVNGDLYAVLNHGFIDDKVEQVTRGNTILSEYYFAIFKTAMEHK